MENKGRFKKGHKTNVGRIVSKETRWKISKANKGKAYRGCGWNHSENTRKKLREYKLGANNPQWKGKKATYNAIHKWLHRNIGKPPCEECGNKKAEWALLKGKEHAHNSNNYKRLCRKHHAIYDRKPCKESTKRKISTANKKRWAEKKCS